MFAQPGIPRTFQGSHTNNVGILFLYQTSWKVIGTPGLRVLLYTHSEAWVYRYRKGGFTGTVGSNRKLNFHGSDEQT
jgi:hypothetical protein